MRKRTKNMRIDVQALERFRNLELNASAIQGKRIGLSELTRRIARSNSFSFLEKEIIEDARLKKRIFNERVK